MTEVPATEALPGRAARPGVMSAFATTFLGHQGWMFRSGSSCVLVDPLLHEEFGAVHALEYVVHPPRTMDAGAPV